VISCILPSGQNWIYNILLELGVYCFYAGHGPWVDPSSGRPKEGSFHFRDNYQTGLPGIEKLAQKQGRILEKGVAVNFSHCAPAGHYLSIDTILWYRHLAGTLYSTFRRHPNEVEGRTVYEFLTQRLSWLGLSYVDAWALYYSLWIAGFNGNRGMSISFDFCKKNPLVGVRSVLSFMNIEASDEAILEAVRASEVKGLLKNAPGWNPYYRAGDPDEFRQEWNAELDSLLSGAPKMVMGHFEGEGDLSFSKMPMGYVVQLIESFCGESLPHNVTAHLMQSSFGEAYQEAVRETSRFGCKMVQLADRLVSDLLNSSLHPSAHYSDPRWADLFKAVIFCLAQPVDSARVRSLVEAVQPRPNFDDAMVTGMTCSVSRPFKS
jgi:hypothetical protein